MANLIIDIGNTRTKLTVFDGSVPLASTTTDNATVEALVAFAAQQVLEHIIVGSVVDIAPQAHSRILSLGLPVLWFDPQTPVPLIENTYRTPHTLGADRLAAVLGAMLLCPDHDILVIDAGTCITYDLIERSGRYLGGNISPGLHMRLSALHEHTGRLPQITAEGDTPPIGYDTETAIRSGVVHGIEHEIMGCIRHIRLHRPDITIYLTGGDCLVFDASIKSIIHTDSHLVARGLNRILQHNL